MEKEEARAKAMASSRSDNGGAVDAERVGCSVQRMLWVMVLAAFMLFAAVVQFGSFPTAFYRREAGSSGNPTATSVPPIDPSAPLAGMTVQSTWPLSHLFATKTMYWDQRHGESVHEAMAETRMTLAESTESPIRRLLRGELRLLQTQIVARHGIRYPTGENIDEIVALVEKLQPFVDSLPHWLQNYTLPYNLSVKGELAKPGAREMRDLGIRSLSASGHMGPVTYSKDAYRLTHTSVPRARDSAIAFSKAFFDNPDAVEYIVRPKNNDTLLRFFDRCPRYQREVKQNRTALMQQNLFEKSGAMEANARRLQQALGLQSEQIDLSTKNLLAAHSACAFDLALYQRKHHWCSLMKKEFAQSMDYLGDLEEFYLIAAGYEINYRMAAVLLREIFSVMKARAAGESMVAGNFFFAHAETTLPLATLLGYGDRSQLLANFTSDQIASRGFRSSVLAPFAANIEFRLYQRKLDFDESFVQILVNEKEAVIPGCKRILCELSELENLWHYYLETYDFQQDCQ